MGLSEEIRALIESWQKDTASSLKALSTKSDVSYPTLRRIMAGECVPTLENCLKILSVVSTNSESGAFLKQHFSRVGEWLSGHLPDWESSDAKLNIYAREKDAHWILSKASETGVTREQIAKRFGESGLQTAECLLDDGLLQEINGRLRRDSFRVLDTSTIKAITERNLREVDPDRIIADGNLIGYHSDGWSAVGHERVLQATKEYFGRIEQLRNTTENRGERHITLGAFINADKGGN